MNPITSQIAFFPWSINQVFDPSDMESLKANMHLFEMKHFIFPFLAHALGTLAGAITVAMLAAGHKMKLAIGIGVFFLAGGITNVVLLPSPMWFNALNLLGAYIPMDWIRWKIGDRSK